MGYVFMTPGKIKTVGQLSRSYDHNMRFRFCKNTDEQRKDENRQVLYRPTTYADFYNERINSSPRYKGRDAAKIRKNAVRAIDVCIAVPSKELTSNPYFSIDQFCALSKEWICKTFGEENVAGITLHMDEHSPHVHAIVIPMTKDGRLCCSEFIGSPEKLSALQDSIAEAMKPLGLERGIKKSVAEHKTMKQFYGAVNKAMTDSLPTPIEGETAGQYARRANIAFNEEKARYLNRMNEVERERDEAISLNDGNKFKEKRIEEREEILKAMQKKIDTNNEALSQWSDIVRAIKRHLLPKDKEKILLEYMQEALSAGKESREKDGISVGKDDKNTDKTE